MKIFARRLCAFDSCATCWNSVWWRFSHNTTSKCHSLVTTPNWSVSRDVCNDCCQSFWLSVCLSVCVCVCDYCKSNRPILLKLGIIIGPTSWKNWLTGGGDPVADHFSTSLTIAEWGILGEWFISISHSHRRPPVFHDTQRSDRCRQVNESTTF